MVFGWPPSGDPPRLSAAAASEEAASVLTAARTALERAALRL